jgi:hypothetical protein
MMLATFAEIGTLEPTFAPPIWLINTMTTSTTATMPTLTDVITVGDCQGGRRLSATERMAAWFRRCFLVSGLVAGRAPGGGGFPAGVR